jgi:hypothetical protein
VAPEDVYICPAGEHLVRHFTNQEHGMTLHRYWTTAYQHCAINHLCTTGKERRITRWEHEQVLETVQHPFGTIKSWMGYTHFQMKTLIRVANEMALHVLAYNIKRVMTIMGIGPLIAAIKAE